LLLLLLLLMMMMVLMKLAVMLVVVVVSTIACVVRRFVGLRLSQSQGASSHAQLSPASSPIHY